jgi:hypothetical protein
MKRAQLWFLALTLGLGGPVAVVANVGCAPACQGDPTAMQIDFAIDSTVNLTNATGFTLSVTMGNGQTYTRQGAVSAASFPGNHSSVVFEPGDLSVAPYQIAISAKITDSTSAVLAQGATAGAVAYQTNGCNFFTITMK